MKTRQISSFAKNIIFYSITLLIITALSSCATKTRFITSSIAPAAEGVVKVKKDNNQNYSINISIANLARPTDLQPPKQTYVVWMEGNLNDLRNIGQIKSTSSLMSKSLRGSFEAVSSVKPKKIFITAENDPSVQYPDNDNIVLTTNYLKD